MTDREKAIVMAYTGYTMLADDKLGIFCNYVQEKLGKNVMTHELAYQEVQDAIKEAAKEDFIAIAKADNVLEAQEPRALTLDEALEADVCWLEKKGDDRVWPCKVGGGEKWAAVWRFDQEPMAVPRDEYGKLFRCWSARPTEEQRKEARWNA